MPQTWNTSQYFPSVQRRIEATERNIERVVAKNAGEAHTKMVTRAPVDTGRFRSSIQLQPVDRFTWRIVSEGVPYSRVIEYGGFRGVGPKTQPAPGGEPGMRDFVTQQAPQGVFRISLMEIERPFQEEIREAVVDGWRTT